jgi:hypothetical protein
MKLLSVKEDNCKFGKNEYLDVTVLRKTPSPSSNYYAVNEVNDDEATVKRGLSPVTSLKIDESPSVEKTQKRTYRSFRKL